MNPLDDPPMPFLPNWKNVKIFLLGLIWCCLLSSGPFLYELWDARNYETTDWNHIRSETALIFGPSAVAYWRKYQALVAPPPDK